MRIAAVVAGSLALFGGNAPSFVVATAEKENALVVLSASDGRVVGRVALPADPENVALDGGLAFVVSTRAGALSVVDLRTLKVVKVFRGFRAPHLAAVAPDGKWIYVTDDASGRLSVIDVARLRLTARVFVGLGAHHLAFSPDQRRVWVALGEHARTIVVLDSSQPNRPRVLHRFDPGFVAHDLVFAPDGRSVWVTSDASREVTVLNARTGRGRFSVDGGPPPQHVAFGRGGSYAYVTSGYGSRIEQVQARSGRVVRAATVSYGSFNVAVGDRFVATSSLFRGTVTFLTRDLRVIRTVHVASAARDVALTGS